MTFSAEMAATGHELLQEFGESILFDRVAEGAFVPSTGAVASGTTTSFHLYGCLIPDDEEEVKTQLTQEVKGTIYVEAGATVPLIGDVCTAVGQKYRVQQVVGYAVNGINTLYKLTVKL